MNGFDLHQKYWRQNAQKYDEIIGQTGDIWHQKVINPIIFKLAGNLQAKVILDAGCGNGYLSNQLAKLAKKVVGLDFTPKFISLAKKRYQKNNLEFKLANLEKLDFLDNYSFDLIICNMVLMDIKNLSQVITCLSGLLKKSGKLIVSITHPCFENPPNTYSQINKQGINTGRVVTNYFKTGLVINKTNQYQHFHRLISDYINTFSKAGLFLEKLVEPNGAKIIGSKSKDQTPYFLIFKLYRS